MMVTHVPMTVQRQTCPKRINAHSISEWAWWFHHPACTFQQFVCAAQSMVHDIMRREVEWQGAQEALNDCNLDQAVLHFLRAVTSLQLMTHATEYMGLFTALGDDYR